MEGKLEGRLENLLRIAGEAIMQVYESSDFEASQKADFSPVTRADHIASSIINEGLREIFPDIPVIDEENPIPDFAVRKHWATFFLLDPLDGTREFIQKNGEFCINLALMDNNRPVASWIYKPTEARGWMCVKGQGIRKFGQDSAQITFPEPQGRKLRVITSRSHMPPQSIEFFNRLGQRYEVEIVQLGSALKQVEIALGKSAMYVRGSGCFEWDTAAGHLMVEESGGQVLQWDMVNTLAYNKQRMHNPPFAMLSSHWQSADIKLFIKSILAEAH